MPEPRASNVVEAPADRRSEIILASAGVFLRFGYKKTSMDDLARASKLSRQGLYLHFPNKDVLFRQVIAHLAGLAVDALRAAVARTELDLEARLIAAFDAMSDRALAGYDPANVRELFASAAELVGDVLEKTDEQIVSELASTLGHARKGRARSAQPSARALAEHLYVVSYGLQGRGYSGAEYRKRMATAVRIVCASV